VTGTAVAAPLALNWADLVAGTAGRAPSGAPAEPLTGVSIDSRTLAAGQVYFAIHGPRFDGHEFLHDVMARGAAAAVVHREAASPEGLPLVRVADTTRALADLARYVRRAASIPVAVVTGSAGKTTTKEMTASLLAARGSVLKTEGNLNNQYGLPLTLLRLDAEHAFAVLELGMSAPGELRALSKIAEPDVAVITNVGPAHLEFFASVDAIAAAKAEVFEGLRPDGIAVLNGDDPRLRRIGESLGQRVLWFGRGRGHHVGALNEQATPFGMRFDLRLESRSVEVALPLVGPHFVMDFLAAAAVAHALGVSAEAIATAATTLRAVRHRGDVRRLEQGLTLIDDCYNSSPDALAAALEALSLAGPRRRVAILGDMLELGPQGPDLHRAAGERAARSAEVLVAVGPLARGFLDGARRAGMAETALVSFPDAEAAEAAALLLEPGDAVLVKGSRGVHLESVVEAIVARFGEGEG
jgi:UDP-N-acetylmuramoyl-tripeptide--D-alanyl-D-alanine ligase